MGLPVIRVETGVLDGIPAVQEHPVPHIKAHMADPRRVVGAHKEHQIPRPRLGYRRGNVVEALRPQPPGIAQAAVGQDIADK